MLSKQLATRWIQGHFSLSFWVVCSTNSEVKYLALSRAIKTKTMSWKSVKCFVVLRRIAELKIRWSPNVTPFTLRYIFIWSIVDCCWKILSREALKIVFKLDWTWSRSLFVSLSFPAFPRQQCGQSPPAQSDDRRQPGCGLRANSASPTGGDRGGHHGYQVPEHCGRDPDRAPWKGKSVYMQYIQLKTQTSEFGDAVEGEMNPMTLSMRLI